MEIGNRMLQQWEQGVELSLNRPEQIAAAQKQFGKSARADDNVWA
jgi:hypothetical protein